MTIVLYVFDTTVGSSSAMRQIKTRYGPFMSSIHEFRTLDALTIVEGRYGSRLLQPGRQILHRAERHGGHIRLLATTVDLRWMRSY
jgi:hypothetical protein